jgi:HEAT repeat protein
MNTKVLVVMGMSLLGTVNVKANVLCQADMLDESQMLVQNFVVEADLEREACKQAMKGCRFTLRKLQKQGLMMGGTCQKIGLVDVAPPPVDDDLSSDDMDVPVGDQYGQFQYELDDLQYALSSSSWRTRLYAVKELANYPTLRALKMAIEHMADSDYDVRVAASKSVNTLKVQVIQMSHPLEVIARLEPLTKSSSWKKRLAAVKTLSQIQSAQTILVMIKMVGDSDYDVRVAAVNGLNKAMSFSDLKKVARTSKRELVDLLSSSSWKTRLNALKVLTKAKVRSTIVSVVKGTADSDYDVRVQAVKALNALTNARNYTGLSYGKINKLKDLYNTSSSWKVRMNTLKALGATLNPSVKLTLMMALDDSDYDVRVTATQELRKF